MENNYVTKNFGQVAQLLKLSEEEVTERIKQFKSPEHSSVGTGFIRPETILEVCDEADGATLEEKLLITCLALTYVLSFRYFSDSKTLIYESLYKPEWDASKGKQREYTLIKKLKDQTFLLSQDQNVFVMKSLGTLCDEIEDFRKTLWPTENLYYYRYPK